GGADVADAGGGVLTSLRRQNIFRIAGQIAVDPGELPAVQQHGGGPAEDGWQLVPPAQTEIVLAAEIRKAPLRVGVEGIESNTVGAVERVRARVVVNGFREGVGQL